MTSQWACLNVVDLATARAAELAAFEADVNQLTARALTGLQRLPVRLRRRAASHRINRLPQRLHRHQLVAQGTSKKGLPVIRKKLRCRRFRRRKLRLLANASRAVVENRNLPLVGKPTASLKPYWLPTHLWHAKRFHMGTRWGWRLPVAPTDKIFKACQKASFRGCIAFDLSYLNCFQLIGNDCDLVQVLGQVLDFPLLPPSQSPPLNEHRVPNLACEQTGLLYTLAYASQTQATPLERLARPILGPARLLWGPPTSARRRYIYLWVHPAMAQSAGQLLSDTVSGHDVQLRDITGQLTRIRLLGRQSHRLLGDVLVQRSESARPGQSDWSVWQALQSTCRQASGLPAGVVLRLEDALEFAKCTRPKLKLRNHNWIETAADQSSTVSQQPEQDGSSWKYLESHLTETASPIADFFSPSVNVDPCLPDGQARDGHGVTVVLVQNGTRSLACRHGDSIGWDVVLLRSPTGAVSMKSCLASRDLLTAFVYRGVEVGGWREFRQWSSLSTRGTGRLDAFPDLLWPDTPSAQAPDDEWQDCRGRKRTRALYIKPAPLPWGELVAEAVKSSGLPEQDGCFVLRDEALLRLVVHRMLSGDPRAAGIGPPELAAHHPRLLCALVLVHVEAIDRGVPQRGASLFATCVIGPGCDQPAADGAGLHLLGYVEEGSYSQAMGRASGLAFLSLAGIAQALVGRMLHRDRSTLQSSGVVMRNLNCQQLRRVRLTLVY